MQRIDPVDDLLERSARNDPGEHGVGFEDGNRLARKAAWEPGDQLFIREDDARMPVFGQGAAQLVGVPARAGAQNRDVHLLIL